MREYQMKVYAKINLGLDVLGRLENGYHEVKMVMQTVEIYDELSFEKTENGITVTTDSGELPTDENNLIYKAAKLMMDTYGIKEGVRIHLQKNIPIAAGMAGGSTDAAATMKGMNRLFDLDCNLKELMDLGVRIGADVPYCILGGTALGDDIALAQIANDSLFEVFGGPVKAAAGQFLATATGEGEQGDVNGVSVAADGTGLGLIEDTEEVIFTEHGALSRLFFTEKIPDAGGGGCPGSSGPGSQTVQRSGFIGGHDAEMREEQFAHQFIGCNGGRRIALCQMGTHEMAIKLFAVRILL